MKKKQKVTPLGKLTKQDKKRTKKRNILIGLLSVVTVAVIVGIVLIIIHNQGTPKGVQPGYTISGTASYDGSQPTGRVYIDIVDSSGASTGLGTSIALPGAYKIRNVPVGTYTVNAWMDSSNPQMGVQSALSPNANISLTVEAGIASNLDLPLVDPDPAPTPIPPTSIGVAGGNGSALVQWSTPQDENGNNVVAQYYNVYYSTSGSVSPQTGEKKTAAASNNLFINGLTDDATYYFIVTSVLGDVESSASNVVSAPVAAGTGENTVTGEISFPLTAKGPLYVGLSNQNGTFFEYISQPASPQAFSISGVPDGDYVIYSVLDMNNNGTIDVGDLSKTVDDPRGGNRVITISGDTEGIKETLLEANVLAHAITMHFSSLSSPGKDIYGLQFELGSNLKRPVKIALVSGPNVLPTDLSRYYNYYHLFQTIEIKPKTGDTYVFAIDYSDGTSEKLKISVTGVLDSFAQNLTTTGTDRNIPTFSWSAPASPPADYTYLIQLGQPGYSQQWTYPQNGTGMPSSQTSVLYNVDGSALLTTLQDGTEYDWLICVTDSNGNQAICDATYTP